MDAAAFTGEDFSTLYAAEPSRSAAQPSTGRESRPGTPRPLSAEPQEGRTCSRPDTPRKGASRQEKLRSLRQQRSALHAANRPALQPVRGMLHAEPCGQENVPVPNVPSKGLADMHEKGLDEESLEDALTRARAVLHRSSALTGATGMPPTAKPEDALQDVSDLHPSQLRLTAIRKQKLGTQPWS